MRAWLLLLATACNGGLEELDGDTAAPTAPQQLPDDVPPEGPATVSAWLVGPFATLPAFVGVADVQGKALLARHVDGTTMLSLAAAGLAPGVEHTAHVHTWPCEFEAGGHYLLDPSVVDGGETNEIWATLTPDADGVATWVETLQLTARGDAISIVIHDPESGDKLACADLAPEQPVGASASGTFGPFAYAETIDETISGTVSAVIGNSSTLDVSLSGLTETETYAAHVHALPCSVTDGGGHYKLIPSVEGTEQANEIWPEILVAVGGTATAAVTVTGHVLREDAQSVVVHRTSAPDSPKVACAELTRGSYLPLTTYGQFIALPTGPGSAATGSAELQRRFDGATVLTLDLKGLSPGGTYPAHLHELPCGVLDGGGHYLVDPGIADGDETNELWANVVADATGAAVRSVGFTHTARAEAQSVVLHAEDGTRLACADLK
jgi:hypothetical protein